MNDFIVKHNKELYTSSILLYIMSLGVYCSEITFELVVELIVTGICFFTLFDRGLFWRNKPKSTYHRFGEIKLVLGLILQVVVLFVGQINIVSDYALILGIICFSLSASGKVGISHKIK